MLKLAPLGYTVIVRRTGTINQTSTGTGHSFFWAENQRQEKDRTDFIQVKCVDVPLVRVPLVRAWFRYVLSKFPQLAKGACVEHLLPMNLTLDDLKIMNWWE